MPDTAASPTRRASSLDDLPLYLPRLFYAFLGLVERRLAATGLDKHLRPGMGHVLLALYEQDDCIIKDVARRMQIANGTLTGLLQGMQKARLVECRRCPQDGRAVRVRLTSLGRSLKPKLRDFHRGVTATLQESLSAREVVAAHDLFERILGSMRADEERARDVKTNSSRAGGRARRIRSPRSQP